MDAELKLIGSYTSLLPSSQQQDLIHNMYQYTQDELINSGFAPGSTIRLRRGISLPSDIVNEFNIGDTIQIQGNALESWSLDEAIAKRFAVDYNYGERGFILEMDVPIEAVVGSARTGFGCLSEGEFVLNGAIPGEAKIIYITKGGQ